MNIKEKTTPPMEESLFWNIIDDSLANSTTEEEQLTYIVERLSSFKPEHIIGFKLRLEILITVLFNTHPFNSLAYEHMVAHREFSYRCYWFVGRGKEMYSQYLSNVRMALGSLADCNYKFQSLMVAPKQALKMKTGDNINDYLVGDEQTGYDPEIEEY